MSGQAQILPGTLDLLILKAVSLVLTGVVMVMALLGLVATWIPAQRALSLEPSILLREE